MDASPHTPAAVSRSTRRLATVVRAVPLLFLAVALVIAVRSGRSDTMVQVLVGGLGVVAVGCSVALFRTPVGTDDPDHYRRMAWIFMAGTAAATVSLFLVTTENFLRVMFALNLLNARRATHTAWTGLREARRLLR